MNPKIRLFSLPLAMLFLAFGTLPSSAQTLATDPLPNSAYCMGDSITVSFTVTGGSFTQGNAFIVQLSDSLGNFDGKFRRILGSTFGTGSGSVDVGLPNDLLPGVNYRIRVVASNPVVFGDDNGSDFSIFRKPDAFFRQTSSIGLINQAVQFSAHEYDPRQTYSWDFGPDATPSTATTDGPDAPPVVFTTTGSHRVSVTVNPSNGAGCPVTISTSINILAKDPAIPSDVTIITGDSTVYIRNAQEKTSLWVCPGAKLTIEDSFHPEDLVIYAEFGAVVDMKKTALGLLYLKDGAEVRNLYGSDYVVLIAEEGATVATGGNYTLLRLPSITFDYSNVPANGCPSLAPYTVQVQPDSRSIHAEEEAEGSGENYLIDPGASLTSTGDGNVYLVESGGSLVVHGNNSRIYLKDGATLDVVEGKGHRIFYEQKATIDSPGADPILLPSSGITFVGKISSVEGEGTTAPSRLDID